MNNHDLEKVVLHSTHITNFVLQCKKCQFSVGVDWRVNGGEDVHLTSEEIEKFWEGIDVEDFTRDSISCDELTVQLVLDE